MSQSPNENSAPVGTEPDLLERLGDIFLAPVPLTLAAVALAAFFVWRTRPAPESVTVERKIAERLVNSGLGFHTQKKLDVAEALYLEATRTDPTFSLAYYDLGVVAWERGDLDQSERWYREALRVEPANSSAADNLKWVLAAKAKRSQPSAGAVP